MKFLKTIKEKEATVLREGNKCFKGAPGVKEWGVKWCNYILISKIKNYHINEFTNTTISVITFASNIIMDYEIETL